MTPAPTTSTQPGPLPPKPTEVSEEQQAQQCGTWGAPALEPQQPRSLAPQSSSLSALCFPVHPWSAGVGLSPGAFWGPAQY